MLMILYVGDKLIDDYFSHKNQEKSCSFNDEEKKEIIDKLNKLNEELALKEKELILSIAKQISDNLENLSNNKSDVNSSEIRKEVMDHTNEVENKVKEIIVGSEDKKNDESDKSKESSDKNEGSSNKDKLNNNQSNNTSKERVSLTDLILDKIERCPKNNLPYFKNPLIEESMRIRDKYKKRAEEREKLNDEKWLLDQYNKEFEEKYQNFLKDIRRKPYLDYLEGLNSDPPKKSLWP
jgi:hypothetical protein